MAVDRAQAPPFSLNVRTTANRPRRFCAAAERSLSSSEVSTFAARTAEAREQGGPLPSTDVADALLDERRKLTERVRN
jgi:hypothetical protein